MMTGVKLLGILGFSTPNDKKVKTLLGDRSAARNLLLVYGI